MSLVIAIKDRDRFVFGADRQASWGWGSKSHDATKIWEVKGLPGAIMGSVGDCRTSQLIQYNNVVDLNAFAAEGGACASFIINSLGPSIYRCLKNNGVLVTAGGGSDGDNTYMLPNDFLFAFEDKAWLIWRDLTVFEIEDYRAIGSGSDVANGVLFATGNKNPFERIATCIAAAELTTLFVDLGVDILTTKSYPKDIKQIKAALGEPDEDSNTIIIDKSVLENAIKKELEKSAAQETEEKTEEEPPKKKKPAKKTNKEEAK